MYHFGKGVKRDYPMAAELYRQACNGQYVWGCSNLGAMYAKGLGVEKSSVKAKNIFSLACGLGDDIACNNYKILANE
jgi:TPR repeat protein